MKKVTSLFLGVFFLTGCGPILESVHIKGKETVQCPQENKCDHLLTYSLPQTYLEFTGNVKKSPTPKPGGGDKPKNNDLESSATATVGNITINTGAQANPSKSGAISPAIKYYDNDGKVIYEITVKEHVFPDPNASFMLKRQGGGFSKDTINISVNNSGLIQSAAVTSDGRVDEILAALARSAGSIIGAFSGLPIPSGNVPKAFISEVSEPEPLKPFKIICKIKNRKLGHAFNESGDCTTNDWAIELKGYESITSANPWTQKEEKNSLKFDYRDGIYYRARKLGFLEITSQKTWLLNKQVNTDGSSEPGNADSSSGQELTKNTIEFDVAYSPIAFIDDVHTFSVQPKRNGFSETSQTMTFENGILLRNNAEFESPVEQIVSLPADIIGGLLSAVSNIFTLRVSSTKAEKDLIDARKNLEAAILQLQSQQNGTPPPPDPVPPDDQSQP